MTCGPNSDSAERNVCSFSTLIDREDSPPCSFRQNQECFRKARLRQEVTRILGHTARFSTVKVFGVNSMSLIGYACPQGLRVITEAASRVRNTQRSLRHQITRGHPLPGKDDECPERMTRSCFRSEPGFYPLRKSLRTVDQRLTWGHGAESKPSTCAPLSHKRPNIAKGPLSTVVVKRANGSSINLGNLRSIIKLAAFSVNRTLRAE